MLNNLKKKRKGKGFTLIELIIVIAIIAIIATIAIPKLLNSKDQANRKADIANAKTLANNAAALMTNDKLTLGADATTFNNSVIELAASGVLESAYTNGNKLAVNLQTIPVSKTDSTKKFYLRVGKDSSITITIGDPGTGATIAATAVEAYPNTAASLN